MSVATDRNKRAMKRGAATMPRKQPSRAQGARQDRALTKAMGKKHRSS